MPAKTAKTVAGSSTETSTKAAKQGKAVSNIKKAAGQSRKKSTTTAPKVDSSNETNNTTTTSSTETVVEQTKTQAPKRTRSPSKKASSTKKQPASKGETKSSTKSASKPKPKKAGAPKPKKTIKKASTRKSTKKTAAQAVAQDIADENAEIVPAEIIQSTETKKTSSKRKRTASGKKSKRSASGASKKKKTPKIRFTVPRRIHNILESVKRYEERIRAIPDSEFKKLDNCYISSYTNSVDRKVYKAEKTAGKLLKKEDLLKKPTFLTAIDELDPLSGHCLRYPYANAAVMESLRMLVLKKVAEEKGVKILGMVSEKQNQNGKGGIKFWKLDPSEGRSKVVIHQADGSEIVETFNPQSPNETIRFCKLPNGQTEAVTMTKKSPNMNWNPTGATVVYVGGVQRFPFERPLPSSIFAMVSKDFVHYKAEEYKKVVDDDTWRKDIPKASDYHLFSTNA